MNHEIMSPSELIESYRSLGYRSTASAIAELVDNSIQAKAKKISIITSEVPEIINNRTLNKITEIAIYDDGHGMDKEELAECLGFGKGSRKQAEDGLGKFGVGLPQASISQARVVTVYSWKKDKCHSTYLSVDEVINKNQIDLTAIECEMPTKFLKHIDGGYKQEHGTLVVWSECDELDFFYSQTLFKKMQFELCRIYRHFLDDDDTVGEKVVMNVIEVVNGEVLNKPKKLVANDPLYLLTPSNVPLVTINDEQRDYSVKPSNIKFGETVVFEGIPYTVKTLKKGDAASNIDDSFEIKSGTASVEIIYSHIDPEIRRNSGDKALGGTDFGKHYKKNLGVSFVRANREIDHGKKGFFEDATKVTLRYLGIEVRFPPTLDKFFGVSNTKQPVKVKKLDSEDYLEPGQDSDSLKETDLVAYFKRKISNSISANIATMKSTLDKQTAGSRGGKRVDPTQRAVDESMKKRMDETLARLNVKTKTPEEIQLETEAMLREQFEHLPQAELNDLIKKYSIHEIVIEEVPWPGEIFLETQLIGSAAQIKINTRHKFYENIYKELQETNPEAFLMFKILLFAYGQSTQELVSPDDQRIIERLNSKWGVIMHRFAEELERLDKD